MAIDATSESRRSTSACIASSATGSVGRPRRTAGGVPAMCMSSACRGVPPPPPGDRSAAAPRRDARRPGALAQRAPGHPGCEPPRLCAVLGGVHRSLSTRSEEFRIRWAAHNVRFHRTGIKRLHHFIVGDLDLTFEALELPADPGLRITTYTAEPGSPSQEGLNLRASWAATVGRLDRTETAPSTDRA